ncbi:UDP-glucose dehydrogenase family protein [Paenibacillus humicola]|uniref:UDP-glucose dehydrogenase family protein n=1 Tax=Paenibacillus humicola TaxID=3110540 RepID=UPI00237A5E1B|nr:UDP-glucose/GDP-mannose dehydrogenase family protein [Paenibacillus humicola]
MKVVCIGSGYVGTVTAATFAKIGHSTTVIDIDPNKADLINAGKSPIFEPGLEELLQQLAGRLLTATTSFQPVREADAVFICVGTPSMTNGSADLQYVKKAAESIGRHLHPERFTVIVNKSTVPVGTADLVASIIEDSSGLRAEEQFAVVSNPEFLREGFAVQDVFFPDRIVVGAAGAQARSRLKALYRTIAERSGYKEMWKDSPFAAMLRSANPLYLETDPKSAEMIKYASNAFLAVKISYINEMAQLCEALGANVLDVAQGMGADSRIGGKFLQVSSGWSGSCLPKDTAEILAASRLYGCKLSVIEAAVEANRGMLSYCAGKLQRTLRTLNGKRIGILGLTFKPDTDDVRETQALSIIQKLLELGASISAYDPKGMEMFRKLHPDLPVRYCSRAEDTAVHADALVLITHWKEFRSLDWKAIGREMRNPYILDTRNDLNGPELRSLGFRYEGIGI